VSPILSQRSPNSVLFAGGLALVSLGVLAYTLTRPTKEKKTKRSNVKAPKVPKFTKTFKEKPFELHLVMSTEEGFYALVAADKKNETQKLKFGARLLKIGDTKVEKWSYEEIYRKLMSAKVPLTLEFREDSQLEKQWAEAEQLKEDGNEHFKKNDLKNSIDLLSKAIALHPTNKVYYSNRVLMYLKSREFDKALEDCRRIRELDPVSRYIKGHYLRGLVLYNLKKYKNAASAFQTVIKINPKFKEAIKRLEECKTFIVKEQELKNEQRRKSSEQFLAMANLVKEKDKDKHSNENKNDTDNNEDDEDNVPALKEGEFDFENNEHDMAEALQSEEVVEDVKAEEQNKKVPPDSNSEVEKEKNQSIPNESSNNPSQNNDGNLNPTEQPQQALVSDAT